MMKNLGKEILLLGYVAFLFCFMIGIFTFNINESILGSTLISKQSFFGDLSSSTAGIFFFFLGNSTYFLLIPFFTFLLANILKKKFLFKASFWFLVNVILLSSFYGLFSSQKEFVQGGVIGNLVASVFEPLLGKYLVSTALSLIMMLALLQIFPSFYKLLNRKFSKKKKNIHRNNTSKENTEKSHFEILRQEEEFLRVVHDFVEEIIGENQFYNFNEVFDHKKVSVMQNSPDPVNLEKMVDTVMKDITFDDFMFESEDFALNSQDILNNLSIDNLLPAGKSSENTEKKAKILSPVRKFQDNLSHLLGSQNKLLDYFKNPFYNFKDLTLAGDSSQYVFEKESEANNIFENSFYEYPSVEEMETYDLSNYKESLKSILFDDTKEDLSTELVALEDSNHDMKFDNSLIELEDKGLEYLNYNDSVSSIMTNFRNSLAEDLENFSSFPELDETEKLSEIDSVTEDEETINVLDNTINDDFLIYKANEQEELENQISLGLKEFSQQDVYLEEIDKAVVSEAEKIDLFESFKSDFLITEKSSFKEEDFQITEENSYISSDKKTEFSSNEIEELQNNVPIEAEDTRGFSGFKLMEETSFKEEDSQITEENSYISSDKKTEFSSNEIEELQNNVPIETEDTREFSSFKLIEKASFKEEDLQTAKENSYISLEAKAKLFLNEVDELDENIAVENFLTEYKEKSARYTEKNPSSFSIESSLVDNSTTKDNFVEEDILKKEIIQDTINLTVVDNIEREKKVSQENNFNQEDLLSKDNMTFSLVNQNEVEELQSDSFLENETTSFVLLDSKASNESHTFIPTIEDAIVKEEDVLEQDNFSEEKIPVSQKELDNLLEAEKEMLKEYMYPDKNLLQSVNSLGLEENELESDIVGHKILSVLKEFNIHAQLENIIVGPVVTRYELTPPKGLKVSKILDLADNISLGLASKDRVRIEAPVYGKSVVGIEVPNKVRQLITFSELLSHLDHEDAKEKYQIPFLLGKGLDGKNLLYDITKMPHLLIAGSTGAGKSVCINTLINSILYFKKPDEVKLLLIDPKRVELILYDKIPHLLTPVIKDPAQAIKVLKWLVGHMEERYQLLEESRVRNIEEYNTQKTKNGEEKMPYIVLIMDEFADLIMLGKRDVEESVIRLAAMSRAVGIHLVLATQRPSSDVITGLIKANFPSRIAFKVSSKVESRIILDENGAESLLGKGDMLFMGNEGGITQRIQAPFLSDDEVRSVTGFFENHYSTDYWDYILEDQEEDYLSDIDLHDEPLFQDAVQLVIQEKKASASYLQRRFKIGYNRAARIIEMMEELGIVSKPSGGKPRDILVSSWGE